MSDSGEPGGARKILGAGPYLCPEQAVVLETDSAKARGIGREFLTGVDRAILAMRREGGEGVFHSIVEHHGLRRVFRTIAKDRDERERPSPAA